MGIGSLSVPEHCLLLPGRGFLKPPDGWGLWRGGQGVKGTLRPSQSWADGAVPRALQLCFWSKGGGYHLPKACE